MVFICRLTLLLLGLFLTAQANAVDYKSIVIEPSAIEINGRNRQTQILITGVTPNGCLLYTSPSPRDS